MEDFEIGTLMNSLRVAHDQITNMRNFMVQKMIDKGWSWQQLLPYDKIEAIKMYRGQFGCTLEEAYQAIKKYQSNEKAPLGR